MGKYRTENKYRKYTIHRLNITQKNQTQQNKTTGSMV